MYFHPEHIDVFKYKLNTKALIDRLEVLEMYQQKLKIENYKCLKAYDASFY